MKATFRSIIGYVFTLIVLFCLVLSPGFAQDGEPQREFRPPYPHPGGLPLRGLTETESVIKDATPAGSGIVTASDIATILSVDLGDPGLSFRYGDTFGITEEAYPASTAHLNAPNGLFVDGSDNLFVTEEFGARILKYDYAGTHSLTIGMAGNRNAWDDRFEEPVDVAVDTSGNIWIVDRSPNRVMQFDTSGTFLRQIGETWASGSDNDHFDWPNGIAFDSGGMLYIADMGNDRVQIFDFDLSDNPVYDDTIAGFNGPSQLAFDSIGRLYVLNTWSGTVERCTYTTGWSCTTFYSGLNDAYGIHIDGSDNIYIADGADAHVLKCNTSGSCPVFAGVTGVPGDDNSHFGWPADIAVDSGGNVFISDDDNHRIQKFNSSGTYLETRGVTGTPYVVDTSRLNAPWGIEVAPDGSIYTAESRGYRLVKLDPAGTQLWTVGEAGVKGSDNSHFGDYWAGIEGGLGLDSSGNVYVPDTANHRVQIFDTSGAYVDTLGSYGTGNYQFDCPAGVAISPLDDSIYVLDRCNQRIQVYDASQNYLDTLGVTGVTGSDNAHFDWLYGVAVDNSGNVYVADSENHRIQIFDSSHTYVRTQGVTGVCGYDFEHFCYPFDVDVDDKGRIYVASGWSNARVQVFDSTGAYLTTVGGAWGTASSQMGEPFGVAVDSTGNLYVTDENLHRIQKYSPGVPGWSQSNLNGFGTPDNTLASTLGEFSGELYSATFNSTSGAEIWKLDGGAWTSTMTGGFSDVDNIGIDHLLEFNGKFYAGTINDTDGGEVWRSDDGSVWAPVVSSGFGDLTNAEIMRFAVFNSQLYASTWSLDASNGGDIWRSSTGNSGEWTQVMTNGFNDPNNSGAIVFEEFNGMLYAGTYNPVTGGEVWRSSDGASWGQVNTDGFGEGSTAHTSGLASFDGYLYASTFNSNAGGATIWRCQTCDGGDWTQVVTNGFGNSDIGGMNGLQVYDGMLHFMTGSSTSSGIGITVWRTSNGTAWEQIGFAGFGDSNNKAPYWDNATISHGGNLYIGTWNPANGGEIWRRLKFGASLDPMADAQDGQAGDTLIYTIDVTNEGEEIDTFDVSLSGHAWTTTANPTIGPLASGAMGTLTVNVTIPLTAVFGDSDVVTVTVTSQGDGLESVEAVLTSGIYAYDLYLPLIMR